MRVCVLVVSSSLLFGCSIETSGLKIDDHADAGRDGATIDARTDTGPADAGTDACLGCECRITADCAPARTEHTDCMPTTPTGPCDTSGTRQRIEISYLCNAGACREDRNTFGEACTLPTDGVACGDPVPGPWTECVASGCGTTGMRTRVVMDPVCMGGSCGATSRMESETCSVDTSGDPCSAGLDCRGRCRSGSCDREWCGNSGDCAGLCPGSSAFCVLSCCQCT